MTDSRGSRSSVRQVFVVTLARSGSTLLRYLLDAHPDVSSPPELNLSALLHHAADTWNRTLDAVVGRPPDESDAGEDVFVDEAYRRARRAVDPIMVRCANVAGASVFCDKSLTTVDHLATVSRCYPKAAFIMLYRYPLDLIASGIEASKWGFNAFGFAPYVGATPGNFVAGLGNYWIDRVSKMLDFENTANVARGRIYYELLCDDPTATMAQLLDFLDLKPMPDLIDKTFNSDHGRGPGDYKIDFTGSVNVASIGRGSKLPLNLAPAQVERMNAMLDELDYPSIEMVRRGDLASLLGLTNVVKSRNAKHGENQVAERTLEKLRAGWGELQGSTDGLVLPLEVVIVDQTGEQTAISITREVAPKFADSSTDGDAPVQRVYCDGDALMRVSGREINLAQAVHDGDIRVEFEPGSDDRRPAEVLKTLVALLKSEGESAGAGRSR